MMMNDSNSLFEQAVGGSDRGWWWLRWSNYPELDIYLKSLSMVSEFKYYYLHVFGG